MLILTKVGLVLYFIPVQVDTENKNLSFNPYLTTNVLF